MGNIQDHWHKIFDIIGDLVSLHDGNFRILRANKAFADAFHLTPEEVIGRRCYELVHRTESPVHECPCVYALNLKEAVVREIYEPRLNLNLEVTVCPVLDEEGNLQGMLHFAKNITEHKQVEGLKRFSSDWKKTEELLRENEARLDLALRSASMGAWHWDIRENRRSFDNQVCYLLGIAPESFRGTVEEVLRVIHPEDRKRVMEALNRAVEQNVPYEAEYRVILPDGSMRHLSSRGRLIHDDNGQPVKINGIVWDITERKQAEEALRESEEKYRQVVASTTDAILIFDAEDGHFIEVNKAARELYGYSAREFLAMRHLDISAEPEASAASISEVKSGQAFHFPLRHHKKKDGAIFPVEISASLFLVKGRKIICGIVRDITERNRLEEQLRQSQKMEAIGLLAGGIAHDFNNMLQAIMGYGSLITHEIKEDGPVKDYLAEILGTSERAAELTRGLLAYSRRQTLKLMTENLNEIVADIQKLLLRIIGEDIELTVTLCPAGPAALVDASQIRQVLINLAANARDAMPTGGKLTISTDIAEMDEHFIKAHGHGERGSYALLSVTDTGIGMDAETRRRIFEPFFTTKEVGKGTGLGLAIAYGVVKQHNGYIHCDSEPGKRTAFSVYLPLIEGKEEGRRASEISDVPGGTETILLAEDDEAVRGATRVFLSDAGYRVIEAINGEDAVEKFKAHKDEIRLLLLDVIMPRRNGREAYEEIRRRSPAVKACFLSGYASDVIQSRAFPDEAFQFIPKPVRPEELLVKVRELLDS